jgi:uncharacterized protein
MNDETPIRAALEAWQRAFCRKDADALMALYASDAVSFDAIPPFSEGPESLRKKVLDCLPYFPESFAIETRDLRLHLGSDLANAHFLWRFIDLPPNHPAGRHWFRSSIVWRKQVDGWRIVHDHCSAPFDPYTEKTVLSPDAPASGTDASCGEHNPVGWFEIYVADMERAKAFYGTVFEVQFARLESPVELWGFPMQPGGYGASGALARIPGLEPGGNSTIVYFSSADCAVQAARATEAGGEVVKPKFAIGQYGFIALVRDSEGNMIGLHSMQ